MSQVTVLMSCHNAEEWLEQAIESVVCQTLKDFEFIIVDDGSTDRTWQIIKSSEERDARIRSLRKPKSGLTDSLNAGLSLARGEWIARLDADDVCHPTRLERQLNFARKNPQVVLIGAGFREIDANGKTIKEHTYPVEHRKLISSLKRFQRFFPHSSAFF